MLILSRLSQERVVITAPGGERISLVVVDIQGNSRVRLGFDAPETWEINRQEIQDEIDGKKTA